MTLRTALAAASTAALVGCGPETPNATRCDILKQQIARNVEILEDALTASRTYQDKLISNPASLTLDDTRAYWLNTPATGVIVPDMRTVLDRQKACISAEQTK